MRALLIVLVLGLPSISPSTVNAQDLAPDPATPVEKDLATPSVQPTATIPGTVTAIATATAVATQTEQVTQSDARTPQSIATEVGPSYPQVTPTKVPTIGTGIGLVTVHALDENGDVSTFGCVTLFLNKGGARGQFFKNHCDYQDGADGTTTLAGLPAGSFILAWGASNEDYSGGADIPFVLGASETFETTVQLVRNGTLVIHKTKLDGSPLLDACFVTYAALETPNMAAQVCDGRDGSDGTITLKVPPGSRWTRETVVPAGYAPADDVLVQIQSAQTTEITIVDLIASSLLIKTTDLWGAHIASTCLRVQFEGSGLGAMNYHYCSDASAAPFFVSPIKPGTYVIHVSRTPEGYTAGPDIRVSVGVSQNKSLKVRLAGPPPVLRLLPQAQNVLQTSAEIYWETDQPTTGSLAYGVTTDLELGNRPPDAESRVHRFRLSNLLPNRTYYVRTTSTNPNGVVTSKMIKFGTPAASSTSRLVVTMTNNDGTRNLGNTCIRLLNSSRVSVWTGCDRIDSAPNDGRLISGMLAPGQYNLEELVSPLGYWIAKPVSIDMAPDKTTRITINHSLGGAVLTVETRHVVSYYNRPLLPGACYQVFENLSESPGALLSQNCDANDGADGLTRLGSLKPGAYLILMTTAPKGFYAYDQDFQRIRVISGQPSVRTEKLVSPIVVQGTVLVRSVDASGNTVKGACYALTDSAAVPSEVISSVRCDQSDGSLDGQTYFLGRVINTRYSLVEISAPRGFGIAPRTSFVTEDDAMTVISVVHATGGHTVRITHRDAESRALVPGSCYALMRGTSTVFAGGCDYDRNGVVEVIGVPDGIYRLVQTSSGSPDHWAPERIVQVDSANVSVFVESTSNP